MCRNCGHSLDMSFKDFDGVERCHEMGCGCTSPEEGYVWRDLSNEELYQRLLHRLDNPMRANSLVKFREYENFAMLIDGVLGSIPRWHGKEPYP